MTWRSGSASLAGVTTESEPGAPPDRVTVDADQVRRLVAEQFPQWSHLPVRAVEQAGWDNRTLHLGTTMSVRLPSGAPYALAVEKEHRWLPALAPHLSLPVPTPLGKGRPGAGYPFSWSVYRWLDGDPVAPGPIPDGERFAVDLAGFLAALRSVDPTDGPLPGRLDWFRGGPLRAFDETLRDSLATLGGSVDADRVRTLWTAARDARWDGTPSWFHGDVARGNLLQVDGRLAAVIDFGTCGVGDPSCDLAAAWTLLSAAGRQVFRDRLPVDDDTWARGRGWALWKSLATCAATREAGGGEATEARRVLDQVLTDVPHRT